MVVRNLAGDVVGDVRLADTVSKGRAQPASNRSDNSRSTKQVAVERRERTTRKGKRGRAVVGQERVGVLQCHVIISRRS
jgi:hypothetical protein